LRNCGSQILKVRNRSFATFFSLQLRNRFGCLQYCGVADLSCGCPPLQMESTSPTLATPTWPQTASSAWPPLRGIDGNMQTAADADEGRPLLERFQEPCRKLPEWQYARADQLEDRAVNTILIEISTVVSVCLFPSLLFIYIIHIRFLFISHAQHKNSK
jgi:hypothetical protein